MDFEIPPRDSLTVEGYGDLSEDTEFLWLMPHMHSRGTHMTVWVGEPDPVTIYETHDWEVPPIHFDPPLLVRANERLGYTCTWVNDTDQTLIFGESAANNEICLIAFQYTAPLIPE